MILGFANCYIILVYANNFVNTFIKKFAKFSFLFHRMTPPRLSQKPKGPLAQRKLTPYAQKSLSSLRESIFMTIPPYLSINSGREAAG